MQKPQRESHVRDPSPRTCVTEHINQITIFTTLMRREINKWRGVSMFKVFILNKMSDRDEGSISDRCNGSCFANIGSICELACSLYK